MTSEQDLPIWAMILLGIPLRDQAAGDSRPDNPDADCKQAAASMAQDDNKQSVLRFEPTASGCKRLWKGSMSPMPGKFQS